MPSARHVRIPVDLLASKPLSHTSVYPVPEVGPHVELAELFGIVGLEQLLAEIGKELFSRAIKKNYNDWGKCMLNINIVSTGSQFYLIV